MNDKDWTVKKSQLWAFIAILFARGAYEAKYLKCSYLWSAKEDPTSSAQTMSRDKLLDILRCIHIQNIRFDKKNVKKSERPGDMGRIYRE